MATSDILLHNEIKFKHKNKCCSSNCSTRKLNETWNHSGQTIFYPWTHSLQEGYKPYLKELENRKPITKYTKRRLTIIEEQPRCDLDEKMLEGAIVIDDENSNSSVEMIEKKNNLSFSVGLKCKLLQFHKNYRPAYYGTWRKRSKQISPKNPFKKDTVQ